MNDYDAWIKEVLDEATSPGGDLNAMVRRIYDEAYDHARETILGTTPKGLPTAFSEWFNDPNRGASTKHPEWANAPHETVLGDIFVSDDAIEQFVDNVNPNRDAPVKPTMHPDLEWLASLPPEKVQRAARGIGSNAFLYRGPKHQLISVRGYTRVPENKQAFTLSEIEQARKHLAKPKCDVQWSTEPLPNGNVRITGTAVSREADPSLDLNNLPDYRLWFDIHGSERTVKYETSGEQAASIHGIYNNFRARLLDELHQAGVIGDDQ